MGRVTFPYTLVNGEIADADQVMADLAALSTEVNGGLVADLNVTVDSAGTITGRANAEGSSAALARADHAHVVQGMEVLTADPTTNVQVGRIYFNSSTLKLRVCVAVGPDSWTDLNPSAATLVVHAAEHKPGGHDPLANNTVTNLNMARTVTTTQILTDPITLSSASWTDLCGDISVTTTPASQLVTFHMIARFVHNTNGTHRYVALRLRDVTGTASTIWRSGFDLLEDPRVWYNGSDHVYPNNTLRHLNASWVWNAPATVAGAHTVRWQAYADGGGVDITKTATYGAGGDAENGPASMVQVVVG